MEIQQSINTDHEDYIQDVAFDYYGNMMASCSNDRKIKIFEKAAQTKIYDCLCIFKRKA